MFALIDVALEPLILWVDVVFVYEPLVIPYSNHAVVDSPFALTVPFRVAALDVTFDAEPVDTVGGVVVVAEDVVKLASLPPALQSPF